MTLINISIPPPSLLGPNIHLSTMFLHILICVMLMVLMAVSSEVWRAAVWQSVVSEEPMSPFFLFSISNQEMERAIPPKRWYWSTRIHGITAQNTATCNLVCVLPLLRDTNIKFLDLTYNFCQDCIIISYTHFIATVVTRRFNSRSVNSVEVMYFFELRTGPDLSHKNYILGDGKK
jgi:hypothetical protein